MSVASRARNPKRLNQTTKPKHPGPYKHFISSKTTAMLLPPQKPKKLGAFGANIITSAKAAEKKAKKRRKLERLGELTAPGYAPVE